jgi:hypothetical protein
MATSIAKPDKAERMSALGAGKSADPVMLVDSGQVRLLIINGSSANEPGRRFRNCRNWHRSRDFQFPGYLSPWGQRPERSGLRDDLIVATSGQLLVSE